MPEIGAEVWPEADLMPAVLRKQNGSGGNVHHGSENQLPGGRIPSLIKGAGKNLNEIRRYEGDQKINHEIPSAEMFCVIHEFFSFRNCSFTGDKRHEGTANAGMTAGEIRRNKAAMIIRIPAEPGENRRVRFSSCASVRGISIPLVSICLAWDRQLPFRIKTGHQSGYHGKTGSIILIIGYMGRMANRETTGPIPGHRQSLSASSFSFRSETRL